MTDTETITLDEYQRLVKPGNKYGAKKVEADGYTFDSHAEYARYLELKLLESRGLIQALTVHPRFELLPAFRDAQGKYHRKVEYEADFIYVQGHAGIAEDVKSRATHTALFKLKLKLFLYKFSRLYEFRLINA